jgi:hypothetical protein
LLNSKLCSSKVGTFKQIQDGAKFEISQTNSILHPTTTIVCQILYETTPPKFKPKFKIFLLAAIVSNTWWAGIKPNQIYYFK